MLGEIQRAQLNELLFNLVRKALEAERTQAEPEEISLIFKVSDTAKLLQPRQAGESSASWQAALSRASMEIRQKIADVLTPACSFIEYYNGDAAAVLTFRRGLLEDFGLTDVIYFGGSMIRSYPNTPKLEETMSEEIVEEPKKRVYVRLVQVEEVPLTSQQAKSLRDIMRTAYFEIDALPVELQDALRKGEPARRSRCWAKLWTDNRLAHDFQMIFNEMVAVSPKCARVYVELLPEENAPSSERIGDVALTPRSSVNGLCTFPFLMEVLYIRTKD